LLSVCEEFGLRLSVGARGRGVLLQFLLLHPAMIVAISVSASVGLFFGFYPAWRASRLDPIVALRRE
jgi:ABC-type lipoprotein release transport system permease subunit